MAILSKNKLYDIVSLNNHARVSFDDIGILDNFFQENDDDDVISILRSHDDRDSSQPTFRTVRVCDNISPHLLQSYFKVRINQNDKFIHKSTACWILTEQNQKLLADRTQRVTQTK